MHAFHSKRFSVQHYLLQDIPKLCMTLINKTETVNVRKYAEGEGKRVEP